MYTPVPSSTPNRLVFPLQKKIWRFDVNPMTIQMTGGRLDPNEMDRFFSAIQVPVDEFMAEFKFVMSWKFQCFAIICALILPLYFVLICYICHIQGKAVRMNKETREKIQEIAREHNQYIAGRGLTWVVPAQCPRWVELWIADVPQQYQAMPMPIPMMPQQGIPTKVYPQPSPQASPYAQFSYPGYSQQPQGQQPATYQPNEYNRVLYGPGSYNA